MKDNIQAYEDLGWILSDSEEGFYLLVASPAMQREVVSHFAYGDVAVVDYARESLSHYYFRDLEERLKGSPRAAAKRPDGGRRPPAAELQPGDAGDAGQEPDFLRHR